MGTVLGVEITMFMALICSLRIPIPSANITLVHLLVTINNGDSGRLALLNDSGEVLSQWGVEGSSQTNIDHLSYKPERDGYYYLLVSAYGRTRSTDYMIWSDFYGDDYPNTNRTDGNLNFDSIVSGKIDRVNDSDWFKVKLNKDDYYEFSYQSSNSSTGTFSLFGPVDIDNGILLNMLNNLNYNENWKRFLERILLKMEDGYQILETQLQIHSE